jgi:hypothetical protein
MDLQDEVEVFRSMLQENGVVSPDGSETILTQLLCSDASAVALFVSQYLTPPKGAEEIAIRSAYSTLERRQMFSKDLIILSLWGQYLESIRIAYGIESSSERIRSLGFAAFRRLDYQEMREMVSVTRSKASDAFYALRYAHDRLSKRTQEPGYLLGSRKAH